MMSPDPQRQWFVYYNEKEMGPFTESDLAEKLKSREIDSGVAYVFTEGMPDWALVADTPVLQNTGPAAAAPAAKQDTNVGVQGLEVENPFADMLGGSSSGPKGSAPKNVAPTPEPFDILPSQPAPQASSAPANSSPPTEDFSKPLKTNAEKSAIAQGGFSEPAGGKTNLTKSGFAQPIGTLSRPLGGAAEPVGAKSSGNTKITAEPTAEQKRKRLMMIVLAVVMLGAGVYFWMDQGGSIPFLGGTKPPPVPAPVPKPVDPDATPGTSPDATAQNPSTPGQPPGQQAVAPKAPQPKRGVLSDADWKKLTDFRATKDPKGPPYSLASTTLGDKFPVVVGVLSPLIEVERVYVAVYPDAQKSLMAIPRIWYAQASVLDGYFSIGPLSSEGKELPPGKYSVLVQSTESFLGETSFELGVWPDDAKLAKAREDIQRETKELGAKEREALLSKHKEVRAALAQLKAKSMVAVKGPKGAREWKAFAKPWYERIQRALRDQRNVTMGPMFFGASQVKLLGYLEEVRGLYESYALLSQGGPRLLKKARKPSLPQQLASINKADSILAAEIGALQDSDAKPLIISPEAVKKGLEYYAATGKSGTK